jgi:hypothetical protein
MNIYCAYLLDLNAFVDTVDFILILRFLDAAASC